MIDIALFVRPHHVPGADPGGVVEVGRLADAAGLHSIHFGEHFVMGKRTDRYPYGPFKHAPSVPWMDPITTMAAIASVTSQIRLSAGVILVPLRPAVVLAKTVATLDVLSRGRVELGIGTGWQPEEYEAAGYAWETRYRRLDESIKVCRMLWEGKAVSYKGDGFTLDDVVALPRPVQDRIPLLYGVAATPINARRIATYGDGWTPVGVTPTQIREGVDRISEEYVRAGRDPKTLRVRAGIANKLDSRGRLDLEPMFSAVPALLEAGVGTIAVAPDHTLADEEELHALVEGVATAARWF